ncbi:PID-CTERM protein-sorting domain-containing protein [Hymenobacter daecheongensis]|nr:hypothetical protein [Hymenobacter daecheongensis]
MNRLLLLLFLIGLGLLTTPAARAQGPGLGGPAPAATNVPLDGGASLLLAGGLALGLRRLRRK